MKAVINLNEWVWVVLNEKAWNEMNMFYERLFDRVPNKTKHVSELMERHRNNVETHCIDGDSKKLLKIQLAEFMEIFGPKMYCGAEAMIEDNNMYLALPNT